MVNLSLVLEDLYNGSVSKAYEFKQDLNCMATTSLKLKDPLTPIERDTLKSLIEIGNIVYNNSDRQISVFEDGLYDLMVKKYADNNNGVYPVGAPPIELNHKDEGLLEKETPKRAFRFMTDEEIKKQENMLFPELIDNGRIYTPNDFLRPAFSYTEPYITKRMKDTAHGHPELVGTMNKCKYVLTAQAREKGVEDDSNVTIVERDFFRPLIEGGIIDPNKEYTMIAELKYDGVSVEADVHNGIIQSARSRGDTENDKATDMTPILRGYTFPKTLSKSSKALLDLHLGVKFEAIVTYRDLPKLNQMKGYNYANGRTAIIGLTGSSDAWKYRDLITLVPISTSMEMSDETFDRLDELLFLNEYFAKKELMRYSVIKGNYISLLFQMKKYVEEAEFARSYLPFMYDGVVFEFYDNGLRKRLGRDNSIDRYKVAVKFNAMKKQTIFREYKYTIGQDGSITPMIYYDPVEFFGTIHPKSSGHSYKRFKDLDLHAGDVIDVEYVNDVMPYVTKPDNEHNRKNAMNPYTEKDTFPSHCPCCGQRLIISKTGSTVYCDNLYCGNRIIKRLASTFEKLGITDFQEKRIEAVGFKALWQYLQATPESKELDVLGPEIKNNLLTQLERLKTTPIKDYEIFGSLGFTSIAKKTWKLIFNSIGIHEFMGRLHTEYVDEIIMDLHIKGIGPTTIETISNEIEVFMPDINYIYATIPIIDTCGEKSAKQIRFTGFRDAELEKKLIDMGFDADGNAGVTKSTDILLIPSENYRGGSKMAKALSYGVNIISVEQFRSNPGAYL